MNPSDEQKGTSVPPAGEVSSPGSVHAGAPDRAESGEPAVQPADPQDSYEDGYPREPEPAPPAPAPAPPPAPVQAIATLPRRQGGGGKTPPPVPGRFRQGAVVLAGRTGHACPPGGGDRPGARVRVGLGPSTPGPLTRRLS